MSRRDLASSIQSLSNEKLQTLIEGIDCSKDVVGEIPELDVLGPAPVYRLRPYALVVKQVNNRSEAYVMEYVRQHTSILVPRVYHILPHSSGDGHWIVMDYIDGSPLLRTWHSLSWWRRIQIVFTLRSYIQQLRRTPLPHPNVPGPFDGTGQPLPCMGGHFLGYRSGPFLTCADLAAWHNDQHHKAQIGFHYRGRKEVLRYSTFDSSCPLVLCHFDLHMRNILVDKNYRVWLIDWDHAGAYPPWFEYTNLASWANAPHPLYRLPRSFAWFISFIAGRYIWYYTNYIAPLILHVETFQHINTNHPVIQRPTDVARPPVRQRMAQIAMDVLYDCLSKMWSFFVPEVAGGRT